MMEQALLGVLSTGVVTWGGDGGAIQTDQNRGQASKELCMMA